MGKKCSKCKLEKSIDDFTHFRSRRDKKIRVHSLCKPCKAAQSLAYHRANRDECLRRVRRTKLKRYGLTEADFAALLEKQKSLCAICASLMRPGRGTHIDHSHATGKVRWLLCNNCNVGIGHFNEDTDVMTKAMEYLRESA